MYKNVIVTIDGANQASVSAGGFDLDSAQDVRVCIEALRAGQQALAECLISLEVDRRIEDNERAARYELEG